MKLLDRHRDDLEAAQQHAALVATSLKAALRKADEGYMVEAAAEISEALEDIRELEDARPLLVAAMRRAKRKPAASVDPDSGRQATTRGVRRAG